MNRKPVGTIAGMISAVTLVLVGGLLVGGHLLAESGTVYSEGLLELGDSIEPPIPGIADILGAEQPGPDWENLFNADGSAKDDYPFDEGGNPVGNGIPDHQELYGGRWVVFAADDVSLGSGFEGTALSADGRVFNSVVGADHDIGNAYVYSTTDSAGNTVLFAAAERLGGGDSNLQFEFNQDHFRLGHGGYGRGEPWEVLGSRKDGDLLVDLNFSAGALGSVAMSVWSGGAWQGLEGVGGEGCNVSNTLCALCNANTISGGPWPNHDTEGDPEQLSANRFVEFGVNVGALVGTQPDYTTVRIRTPQDTAFAYFAEGN